jgi:phosphate-selective porin OprO and OprP
VKRALFIVSLVALTPTIARADFASTLASIDLAPTTMAQLDYDAHAAEGANHDGFVLQRARLGLRVRPVPWLLLVTTVEYANGKVLPFEVLAEAVARHAWYFSVGFRRTPLFHSAKDELIESLPIPELSLVTRALWPGVDLGADVHYQSERVPVEAWLRVGNGSQNVAGNDNNYPALDLRVDAVLGKARVGHEASWWGFRAGLGGHAKYRQDTTGLYGSTPDGFVFYHPVPTHGWQAIGEAHVTAWLGRWTIMAEGGVARDARSGVVPATNAPALPVYTWGASLEVACMIWGRPRPAGQSIVPGRFPNEQPLSLTSWRGGEVEIAARLERVDLDLHAPDIVSGGAEGGALAVNWWATPYTALTLAAYDYYYFLSPIEQPGQKNFWLVMARTTLSFR